MADKTLKETIYGTKYKYEIYERSTVWSTKYNIYRDGEYWKGDYSSLKEAVKIAEKGS